MTPEQTRTAEMIRGRAVKRRNAFTAVLAGFLLAAFAVLRFGTGATGTVFLIFPAGILGGILYANAFEYTLHRFVLHWGRGFLVQRHALHHDSAGAANEARYVNFATSPWVVVLVFALNALPVFAAAPWLGGASAAGLFAGFTAYFVLYEEIHWRLHFGGWLPAWLRFARKHHRLHHAGFGGRYNVFLPICDWIFHRRQWSSSPQTLPK